MDDQTCPPPDVWEDFQNRVYHTDENQVFLEHLHEHLAACASCRDRNRPSKERRDRSKQWATLATLVFGLVGFSLVLLVSFRTNPAPAPVSTQAPTTTVPAPTVITRVIPASSSGPAGE